MRCLALRNNVANLSLPSVMYNIHTTSVDFRFFLFLFFFGLEKFQICLHLVFLIQDHFIDCVLESCWRLAIN